MADARELIGRTLGGRFRLTAFLGEGAMAAVYRGEQDAEPRDVAVKVMHTELLRDETFAKRFAREAKAAARIEHRNSVRILEHGADGDLYYLAMELLVGQDLFDTLARLGKMPELRAVRALLQVTSALEAAHAQGIVHRDLKPENVFMTRDPDDPEADLVKVLDFGIAKVLERERRGSAEDSPPSSESMSAPPSSVLTRVGSIVGTPEYMSPEQAMGLPVDPRSDVYSCGVLLFQMVTGRAPFIGSTPLDVLIQQADKAPPAPSSLVAGIHPGLEAAIVRALAKKPEDRFQSARALRETLARMLPELAGDPEGAGLGADSADFGGKAPVLPGVPGAVAIAVDKRRESSGGDEPPQTMRSPAHAVVEAPAASAPPDAKPTPPAEASPRASATAAEMASRRTATTVSEARRARESAPAEEPEQARAALTPADPEAVAKPKAALTPKAAVKGSAAVAAPPTPRLWVYVAVGAVIVALIWLARYLHVG